MKHKHHITPRYRGGSDHQDNLISLSVTQHAMFHYCNWKLWDRWEDYFAWKGLKGEIGKEEIVAEARRRGREKGSVIGVAKIASLLHNDPSYRENQLEHLSKSRILAVEAAKQPESIEKKKRKLKEIKHQQGDRNSQFGTMWVTNGLSNKKIKKGDPLPEGYFPGRKLN